MKPRKILAAGALAVAGFFMAGCATGQGESPLEHIGVVEVEMSDRTVECVKWKVGYAGGLQCDFQGSAQ
ncbi:hypothetical protein [Brevibacterium album]|uniref:hypothetical protein n=1 Tax=Brevibacterium album TaxID=417948 RepID=UPI0003FB6318|nr:hypothetical protein [Brevibacterium album]